jgi:Flp pilus assembly pilin Flp
MVRAKARLTDESGAMVIEYALLLAVISMAITVKLLTLETPICQLIDNVNQLLGSPASNSTCTGAGTPVANVGSSGNNGNNGNGNGTGNGKGNNGVGGGNGGGSSNGSNGR